MGIAFIVYFADQPTNIKYCANKLNKKKETEWKRQIKACLQCFIDKKKMKKKSKRTDMMWKENGKSARKSKNQQQRGKTATVTAKCKYVRVVRERQRFMLEAIIDTYIFAVIADYGLTVAISQMKALPMMIIWIGESKSGFFFRFLIWNFWKCRNICFSKFDQIFSSSRIKRN